LSICPSSFNYKTKFNGVNSQLLLYPGQLKGQTNHRLIYNTIMQHSKFIQYMSKADTVSEK